MTTRRIPNALRTLRTILAPRPTETRPRGLSIDPPGRNCSRNKRTTHGKFIVLSIYLFIGHMQDVVVGGPCESSQSMTAFFYNLHSLVCRNCKDGKFAADYTVSSSNHNMTCGLSLQLRRLRCRSNADSSPCL